MKTLRSFVGSVAALAVSAGMALAADYTLTISSWAPPSHGMNAIMWPNLTKMIEDATDGRVTAEIKYGIAPPPAQMDLVIDGAADMVWIFHGYTPGRFVGTKLIELPGYDGNAEAASTAYWRVHEKYLAAMGEHDGMKLVALMTHGPGNMHTNKELTTLAEMNGLKTRIGGGVAGNIGDELGLIGIRVPAPKVYETLSSGAADGVTMPIEGRKSFKLTEVAKNFYEMPGGLYRGSFAVLMSQETFDGLPADIQKALDEKVFGEPASRMAGAAWDMMDAAGREATLAAPDNKLVVFGPDQQAAFKPIADKVTKAILAEVAAKGVDAEAAHDMIQAEMSKVMSE